MKKGVLLLVFVLLLGFFLSPIPFPWRNGAYNAWSGILWCKETTTCYHEIGHKLDQESDWISHSPEFQYSLQVYLFYEIQQDEPAKLAVEIIERTFSTPNKFFVFSDPNAEAYAIIFEYSRGRRENMPEMFRDFYDWELAENLIAKYIRKVFPYNTNRENFSKSEP